MDYLNYLEAQAIEVLREVAAQFSRPVLLFSGGKDSLCLIHLSLKAFRPEAFPYRVMHIDTGHNFPETLEFRDRMMKEVGEEIIVRKVEDTIAIGLVEDERGPYPSRNRLQSRTLLDAMREFHFDAAIGGARRDEEKARAKERFFSHRNSLGAWNPRDQRPELWSLYNGRINQGEQVRVFPLSNWTEKDVWRYLKRENISVPSLYFSHLRKCVKRSDGLWLAWSPYISPGPKDEVSSCHVRFRTVGDMTCTSPVFSLAANIDEVIDEISVSLTSERGTRADDQSSENAMEERKREGYF